MQQITVSVTHLLTFCLFLITSPRATAPVDTCSTFQVIGGKVHNVLPLYSPNLHFATCRIFFSHHLLHGFDLFFVVRAKIYVITQFNVFKAALYFNAIFLLIRVSWAIDNRTKQVIIRDSNIFKQLSSLWPTTGKGRELCGVCISPGKGRK